MAWWVLFAGLACQGRLTSQPSPYPAAPRGNVVEEIHGTQVADPYRWLEEVDSRRTAEWVKAQNALTQDSLKRIPGREAIRRRLTSLWSYSRTDVPWREAGRLFFIENAGLQPQPVLYAQKGLEDRPRPVLDPNTISPDGSVAGRPTARLQHIPGARTPARYGCGSSRPDAVSARSCGTS